MSAPCYRSLYFTADLALMPGAMWNYLATALAHREAVDGVADNTPSTLLARREGLALVISLVWYPEDEMPAVPNNHPGFWW